MGQPNTKEEVYLSNIANNTRAAISPGSVVYLSGTYEFTGPFFAITALTDTVIDASECTTGIKMSNGSGAMVTNTVDFTVEKGWTIFGQFSTISLVSGTALAYVERGVTVTVAAS